MARKQYLSKEDHRKLHEDLHHEALGQLPTLETAAIAESIAENYWEIIEAFLPEDVRSLRTVRIVYSLLIDGCASHAKQVIDALGTIRARTSEGRRAIPAYVGVGKVVVEIDDDGQLVKDVIPKQMHLLDLAWDQFRQVYDKEYRKSENQQKKTALLGLIWTFRDKYPAMTPRQALIAEGIDPDELDLTEFA